MSNEDTLTRSLRDVTQQLIAATKMIAVLQTTAAQQTGQIAALQFALGRLVERLPNDDQIAVSVSVDLNGALLFKEREGAARDAFIAMRDALIPKEFPRPESY
jgi:hypothetical protein